MQWGRLTHGLTNISLCNHFKLHPCKRGRVDRGGASLSFPSLETAASHVSCKNRGRYCLRSCERRGSTSLKANGWSDTSLVPASDEAGESQRATRLRSVERCFLLG